MAPCHAVLLLFLITLHFLLHSASDDIPKADTVRTLLKDLREARQAKARQGLKSLDPHYLQVKNIEGSRFVVIQNLTCFYYRWIT